MRWSTAWASWRVSGKNRFDACRPKGRAASRGWPPRRACSSSSRSRPSAPIRQSDSAYARTKAAGESRRARAFPGAVILRPSIIFGPEDQFFNRFAGMTRLSPFLPIAGGRTRFQPVYVDDVAQAAAMAAMGEVAPGIYELGGPDVRSFRELMEGLLAEIRRKRVIVSMPWFMARGIAAGVRPAADRHAGAVHQQPDARPGEATWRATMW
jgi:uncharacterized protein YbjT (DUF2867 family)